MARQPIISKSSFIRGKQCLKSLYLIKNFPELRDVVSSSQQAIFDRGHSVGELAQDLFPGGKVAAFDLPWGFRKSISNTQKLIESGESILYEAGFLFKNTHCFVDILVKDKGKWHIYEVKSSTGISDTYLLDAAFQYRVLTGLGMNVSDISIIYINNQYTREGLLDIHQLFTVESVLDQITGLQEDVESNLITQVNCLLNDDVPVIDIGSHCFQPYSCDFMGHCWKHIPDYSVFDINKLRKKKKFELYDRGILNLTDVPDDFPLSDSQYLQVDSEKTGLQKIDKEGIKHFLSQLNYPLYFLDFETFNPAIPPYDFSRPYQQIVFQYSLHILNQPGGELIHAEYLGDNTMDPRPPMIKQLTEELGDAGDIVVYNKGFESGRLSEIARNFPEYKEAIDNIQDRLVDLMIPFQQKLYYTPEMKGSYSIKDVLPALCPSFTYKNLSINNGSDASISFEKMAYEKNQKVIDQTRKDLLAYCKLDTLAMVEILRVLEGVVGW